jgi:hypothetical protein
MLISLSSPFLLKVQILPVGETTVLRVEEDTNVLEIIRMVEEKKQQNYSSGSYSYHVLLTEEKRVQVLEEMTLKNYRQIERFLLGRGFDLDFCSFSILLENCHIFIFQKN